MKRQNGQNSWGLQAMPLTPFHFGPGSLAKSVAPGWFSFRAFVLSQIVIDCETAWNIYRGHERLHTLFHSYLGVFLAMILTGTLLVVYNRFIFQLHRSRFVQELGSWNEAFELRSSSIAILFGGWSHVFLDSVMHADMRPLGPFSSSNVMLDLVSLKALHLGCLWSFVAASLLWGGRVAYRSLRENFNR